jgi:hypothetical protein
MASLSGLVRTSVVLVLGLGGLFRFAAAQVARTRVATGSITGRVLDDSARALVGAEAVIIALRLRAVTNVDGQFRLEGVPSGTWSILLRAIGFLPNSKIVQVGRGSTELGPLALHRAAVILPELEVTGKLPAPAFGLGFATNLEAMTNCAWCGRAANYLPFGASMTEDGLYLAMTQPSGRNAPPWIAFRERPVGLGGWGHAATHWIQCNKRSSPVATRIDGVTARILYSTGAIWLESLDRWSDECFQAIPLVFEGAPLAAAPLAVGWVVALEDSAGNTTLQGFNDFGKRLWTVPLATVLGSDTRVKNVILAPALRWVTVSLSESPFSWALVESTGSVVRQSSPFIGSALNDLLSQPDISAWRSYAVLPVRNGFVQTLESPRRQNGLLVLYDILGRPVKVMRRAGVSVLIASAPDLRMLFGYKYNNPLRGSARLFVYRY